jgi:hypothetical protein
MYEWIWRRLPASGTGGKAVWMTLIVVVLLALLWLLVFPWATIHLPIDQV